MINRINSIPVPSRSGAPVCLWQTAHYERAHLFILRKARRVPNVGGTGRGRHRTCTKRPGEETMVEHRRVVVGVFPTRADAEQALAALRDAGFAGEDVSLLTQNP